MLQEWTIWITVWSTQVQRNSSYGPETKSDGLANGQCLDLIRPVLIQVYKTEKLKQ